MSRLEPTDEASAMQKEISAIAEQGGGRATKVEQLIQQYCPNGVEYKRLEDCLNYEQPTKYIVKDTKYDDTYPTPVLTAGQTFILGYTNEKTGIYQASKEKPVIIFDDFTTGFHWVDFDFKVKSSAMKMLRPACDDISFRYVYYAMSSIHFEPGTHTRHWISIYSQFEIPVPPLPVQEEIVRILDTLTELQAELQAELQKRLQQYNYYRDNLLSFEGRTDVKWKKLGEITTILRGKRLIKSQLSNDKPYAVYHGGLEPLGYYESANRTANTTMIINVGASAGTIGYSKEDFWSSDGCYCVEHSKLFDDRYIYYALQTKEQQLKSKVRVAGIPTLDKPVVEDLLVPIPPLTEQQRIVNILDRFDALTTDITAGLPAEIEARRKQYEYYRDKLLTFKQKA